jgi:FHS family L-fucose permease-like MFS transporter
MTRTGQGASGAGKSALVAFACVTTLFFIWGFVTATIDPLIPAVRSVFSLSYTESMLTQFAFFMAYGVVSLPAAALLAKAGAVRSILIALAAMVVGCLIVPLATVVETYALVLVALFIIASGITLLQVAANPLAAVAGDPKRSHFRLTLSQAFNSLATVLAPYIGANLMLKGITEGEAVSAAQRAESLRSIDTAFFIIAGAIVLLGVFLWLVRGRINQIASAMESSTAATPGSPLAAFRSPWALAGAAAIFLYVGSEVAIGSTLTNYLASDDVLGVSLHRAGELVSLYWLGAMIGRFIGSALLFRLKAGPLLAVFAVVAAVLCFATRQSTGWTAAVTVLAIGLLNSIMFPTIFTLTLERSSAPPAATSGLLCMAIVGGAFLPLLAGVVADRSGLSNAFWVPLAGYLGIAVFAFMAAKARVRTADVVAAPGAH